MGLLIKSVGWERDSNQWPVLSRWVISYWIGSSRGLERAGAEGYTAQRKNKEVTIYARRSCEDTGVENTFWRGWIDMLRLLTAIFSSIYLSYPSLRLCRRTSPPPPTHTTPKNEQRNEWLKGSTVENRLKREREREMSTSTTTSKIQQRYMFYTLASLTYWRNTAREAP